MVLAKPNILYYYIVYLTVYDDVHSQMLYVYLSKLQLHCTYANA